MNPIAKTRIDIDHRAGITTTTVLTGPNVSDGGSYVAHMIASTGIMRGGIAIETLEQARRYGLTLTEKEARAAFGAACLPYRRAGGAGYSAKGN